MNAPRPCLLGCRTAEGVPYRAAPGWHVCHPCSDRLRIVLDTLERTYTTITAIDELIPSGHGTGTGVRTPPGPRSPAVDAILIHTDRRSTLDNQPAALATVESWARMVREELGAAVPAGRVTMARELELLRSRWDWIMYQAWVDEFAAEMRAVLQALRMVEREQPGAVMVGKCPTIAVPRELSGLPFDLECGATLRVRPGATEIRCRNCDTVWPRARWRQDLGQQQMDYATLAAELAVPTGTLRRWALEDAWQRSGTPGRPLFAVAEVEASYVRRRGTLPRREAG